MAKGGVTTEQRKALGRNRAKIANQKSGSKPSKDFKFGAKEGGKNG